MSIHVGKFRAKTDRALTGVRSVVQVPTPAAAADFTVAVPSGQMWRILTLSSTFTASATVASRFPGFAVAIDGQQVWSIRLPTAVTANTAVIVSGDYNLGSSVGASSGGMYTEKLPDVWLPEASVFSSTTLNLSAGDTWTGIFAYVEKNYVTDGELTDDAIERDDDMQTILAALAQAASQTTPGA